MRGHRAFLRRHVSDRVRGHHAFLLRHVSDHVRPLLFRMQLEDFTAKINKLINQFPINSHRGHVNGRQWYELHGHVRPFHHVPLLRNHNFN